MLVDFGILELKMDLEYEGGRWMVFGALYNGGGGMVIYNLEERWGDVMVCMEAYLDFALVVPTFFDAMPWDM